VLLQLARQPEMKSKSNELPLSSCCKCVLHQREPTHVAYTHPLCLHPLPLFATALAIHMHHLSPFSRICISICCHATTSPAIGDISICDCSISPRPQSCLGYSAAARWYSFGHNCNCFSTFLKLEIRTHFQGA